MILKFGSAPGRVSTALLPSNANVVQCSVSLNLAASSCLTQTCIVSTQTYGSAKSGKAGEYQTLTPDIDKNCKLATENRTAHPLCS